MGVESTVVATRFWDVISAVRRERAVGGCEFGDVGIWWMILRCRPDSRGGVSARERPGRCLVDVVNPI